jgi:predicted acyltransferase
LLFLAAFYQVVDVRGRRRWSFPLVVIGMNSIAAYCMDHLFVKFIEQDLSTHLGPRSFYVLGDAYAPLLEGAAVLTLLWLILLWMYQRRIFLRI